MPKNERDRHGSPFSGAGYAKTAPRIIEITGNLREQAQPRAGAAVISFAVDPARESAMIWNPITGDPMTGYNESEFSYG